MPRPRPRPHRVATAYRVAWCTVAGLVCAVGFAAGCVYLGIAAAVCLTGTGAVLGGTAALPRPGVRSSRGALVEAGLVGAVLPMTGIGLVALLGSPALLLCLLLAAGALPLRRRPVAPTVRRLPAVLRPPAPAPGPPSLESVAPDPLPPVAAVPGLPTAELCRVWRVSYLRLQRCTWSGERGYLAQLRRACLDELERRDPQAFARWVATARAAGDPGRVFGRS